MLTETRYKVVNGTSYHIDTPDNICQILENCRTSKTRIIVDYGDTVTGQSWGERYDIRGYVGRSTGTHKIPLLIYNRASIGGGGISDNRIIKISESKGGRVLYQHSNYKPANN